MINDNQSAPFLLFSVPTQTQDPEPRIRILVPVRFQARNAVLCHAICGTMQRWMMMEMQMPKTQNAI